MRKVKRLCCMFLLLVVLSNMIIRVGATNMRTRVIECPNCGYGTMHVYTTQRPSKNVAVSCTRHEYGIDYYVCYEVLTEEICDSCGYSSSNTKLSNKFVRCEGWD